MPSAYTLGAHEAARSDRRRHHPAAEYSLTEAATAIGASLNAVHYEAGKLSESGLISTRRRGNLRLVRAVTDSLLTRPLTDLLAVTYGPLPVLTDLHADVEGISGPASGVGWRFARWLRWRRRCRGARRRR